ncbi:hypothetical protein EJD97_024793 [Solanum chilense]|uniref:Uncharacterized protein n=1 Tax=Solanum chilense TaxID=4083 RepID=A0A6N2AYB4_SOLCI|nr:hypothetical protein EJD97_024793 [Solanum chilense]
MMKEKLGNGETSEEQSHGNVAWEGDVYSQVLGNEKSGYVRGSGLGPTPSLLWGRLRDLAYATVRAIGNLDID